MDKFSKQDTAVVKGIAALMLVCHHFFMGILPAPIDWANNELWTIAATLSKVCVAIFVILSGYGINESYKKWSGMVRQVVIFNWVVRVGLIKLLRA